MEILAVTYPANQTLCRMMHERLHSIMTREVVTLRVDQTVAEAYTMVRNRRFHHLPVVDNDGKLVGIITSFDLLKMGVCPDEYSQYMISDVMTTHVAYLSPEDQIGAAAEVFMEHLFHGLPICDDEMRLVGIVTTHDILKYEYFKEYPAESTRLNYQAA